MTSYKIIVKVWRATETFTKLFLFSFIGYMIGAAVVEIRISSLRSPITEGAIKTGVEEGVKIYKKEAAEGIHLDVAKRLARDMAVRKYIKRLDQMMNYKEAE